MLLYTIASKLYSGNVLIKILLHYFESNFSLAISKHFLAANLWNNILIEPNYIVHFVSILLVRKAEFAHKESESTSYKALHLNAPTLSALLMDCIHLV